VLDFNPSDFEAVDRAREDLVDTMHRWNNSTSRVSKSMLEKSKGVLVRLYETGASGDPDEDIGANEDFDIDKIEPGVIHIRCVL